jgi:hypothetical protein
MLPEQYSVIRQEQCWRGLAGVSEIKAQEKIMYLPGKVRQAQGRRLTALEIAKELEEHINQTGATFDMARTIGAPQMIVDAWNEHCPIGIDVIVTKDDGEEICTKTCSSAWLVGSIPVIQFEGIAGCYALDRVRRESLPKPH